MGSDIAIRAYFSCQTSQVYKTCEVWCYFQGEFVTPFLPPSERRREWLFPSPARGKGKGEGNHLRLKLILLQIILDANPRLRAI